MELGYSLLHLRRELAARLFRVPRSHCPPGHAVEDLIASRALPAVRSSVQDLGAGVLRELADARRILATRANRLLLFPLARARILEQTLAEAQRDGFRVLEEHVMLTPLRKFLIAWRTRLGAR